MKLNKGEVLCPKCNGMGGISVNEELARECPRCYGARKLDWIELCIGKQNPYKIKVEKVQLTAKARKLKEGWTIKEEDPMVLISEELLEEFAKIENKE